MPRLIRYAGFDPTEDYSWSRVCVRCGAPIPPKRGTQNDWKQPSRIMYCSDICSRKKRYETEKYKRDNARHEAKEALNALQQFITDFSGCGGETEESEAVELRAKTALSSLRRQYDRSR